MGIATLTKSASLLSSDLYPVTDTDLQQLHNILLEMAADISEICQENHIQWSLSGGSILGAVRHRGFIPWDDDIDLFMFRKDLEKFKTVFPGRYAEKYMLQLPGDEGYLYHFPKICRKNTTAQSIQSAPDAKEYVSIDIFVIENTYNGRIARTLHGLTCTAFLLVDSIMRMKRCEYNMLKYGSGNQELCRAVKKRTFFAKLFCFFPLEKWLLISDRVFSICQNTETDHVVVPSGTCHFFGEIYERSKLHRLKLENFEDRQFYIPEDSDYYLRIRYGNDYMTPPDSSKQEQHVFIKFDLTK